MILHMGFDEHPVCERAFWWLDVSTYPISQDMELTRTEATLLWSFCSREKLSEASVAMFLGSKVEEFYYKQYSENCIVEFRNALHGM